MGAGNSTLGAGTTGAAQASGTAGAAGDGSGSGLRGGFPRWLPAAVVLILVVVVGGAIVLGSLTGAEPAGGPGFQTLSPTLAPTVLPDATASGSPSPTLAPTEEPTPTPTPTPTPQPTAPPTEAVSDLVTLTGASASSVVGNREKFSADKVIDARLDTSWQEGATDEAGQWIEVTFGPARVDYIVIHSGYQLSYDAYLANRRPREILVSLDGGTPVPFTLADTVDPQRLDLDGSGDSTRIQIEIVSTYDPEKTDYPGSPFDDMAISEIVVFGFPGG